MKDELLRDLGERAKELKCLYEIDKILKDYESPESDIFSKLVEKLPEGWQFDRECQVRIIYGEREYSRKDLVVTGCFQKADLKIEQDAVGRVEVYYPDSFCVENKDPFLEEEQKLLDTVAERISVYIFHLKLKQVFGQWAKAKAILDGLQQREGKILEIFRHADVREIVEYMDDPEKAVKCPRELAMILTPYSEEHWKWRKKIAEIIAQRIDPDLSGVRNVYLFGSTKNAEAGPASDIDLLIHFAGTEEQKKALKAWLNGWSQCLAEINYLKTGFKLDELLDYHIITDQDIKNRNSYAIKINAVTDAARRLNMKGAKNE